MDAQMTNFETRLRENAARTEALLGRLLSGETRADEIARPQNLLEAMRHGVLNGGKRLRPFLVIESAALLGGDGEAALLPVPRWNASIAIRWFTTICRLWMTTTCVVASQRCIANSTRRPPSSLATAC